MDNYSIHIIITTIKRNTMSIGIYKHTMIAIEGINLSCTNVKLWKCDIEFTVSAIAMPVAGVSVAASIISSLLVMAGDIEENPGPRGG